MAAEPPPMYSACLSYEAVPSLVKELYGWTVDTVRQLPGYDDLNYFIQRSPSSESAYGSEFVLKVVNSFDSIHVGWTIAQARVMIDIREKGVVCPIPVANLKGEYYSLEEIVDKGGQQPKGLKFLVIMMVFIPGTILRKLFSAKTHVPDKWYYTMGKNLASIDKALMDFNEPTASAALREKARVFPWSALCIPNVRSLLWAVKDMEKRHLAERVLDAFDAKVIPKTSELRQSILHADYNDMNIIGQCKPTSDTACQTAGGKAIPADSASELDIQGVIDFSDIVHTCLVFDPGNSQAYMMMSQRYGDPLVSGCHFLAGYNSVLTLTPLEKDLVWYCTAGRLVQTLVKGLHNHSLNPSNAAYILDTQTTGWSVLQRLWDCTDEHLARMSDEITALHQD